MWRALQTAQPLCGALKVDLRVDPALCDVGGHFTAADADESEAEAPSSADDILNSFGLSDAIIDESRRLPAAGRGSTGWGERLGSTANCNLNAIFPVENHTFQGCFLHCFCICNATFREKMAFISRFAVKARHLRNVISRDSH